MRYPLSTVNRSFCDLRGCDRPDIREQGPAGSLFFCQISNQRISLAASLSGKLEPPPRYTVVDWSS